MGNGPFTTWYYLLNMWDFLMAMLVDNPDGTSLDQTSWEVCSFLLMASNYLGERRHSMENRWLLAG